MRILFLLLATVTLVVSGSGSLLGQPVSYDDVMLIVNDSSRASVEIGNYFAERRGMPSWRICHIKVDTSESMDSAAFIRLKWQIEGWMRENDLVDSINYIVTTKGCPLRIRTAQRDDVGSNILGGLASFEDCLALMNGSDSSLMLSTRSVFYLSKYFGSEDHFRRDPEELPMYLVTRLDGYTVEDIKSYIRRSEEPAVLGDGLWVLDVAPGRDANAGYKPGNDWIRGAAEVLKAKQMNVLLNTDNVYLHNQKDVIGYASWGSNDANSGGGIAAKPGNTWLNGSIAETIVSTSGRSFMPGTGYGQSLIADLIAEGVCGVKGYTDEPYLVSIAHPDIVFDRYTSGFNMAESFYAGSQFIAWRQVLVGDPKMRLASLVSLSAQAIDFGSGFRYAVLSDMLWVRNTRSTPVRLENVTLSGEDAKAFSVVFDGAITIAPGDSAALMLTARPVSFGDIMAELELDYRRPGDDRSFSSIVLLKASGLRPVIGIPDTMYFDAPGSGGSVVQNVVVRNITESDTVTVSRLTFTGKGAGRFSLEPGINLPFRIPQGEKLEVPVRYTASAAGNDSAALVIRSDAEGIDRPVYLVGRDASSGVEHDVAGAAGRISIAPNPFGSRTEIRYNIGETRRSVCLEILDIFGRTVATVAEGMKEPGEHIALFDASALPPGIYHCRLAVTTPQGVRTSVQPLLHDR